jgi:hypothetical protein
MPEDSVGMRHAEIRKLAAIMFTGSEAVLLDALSGRKRSRSRRKPVGELHMRTMRTTVDENPSRRGRSSPLEVGMMQVPRTRRRV